MLDMRRLITLAEVTNDEFRQMLAVARERIAKRNATADALAAAGKPVRFIKPGWKALAGPDMSKPGGFRVTEFNASGPIGHREFNSLRDAIVDALTDNYEPVLSEAAETTAGKADLPMDQASRMERAIAMGYTVMAYHGTNSDLKAFKSSKSSGGIYFGNKAAVGDHYAQRAAMSFKSKGEAQAVYPVLLRMTRPKVMDAWDLPRGAKDNRGWLKKLRDQGYDGLIVKNAGPVEQGMGPKDKLYVVFQPQQVRSVFARFDPAKSNSSKLTD